MDSQQSQRFCLYLRIDYPENTPYVRSSPLSNSNFEQRWAKPTSKDIGLCFRPLGKEPGETLQSHLTDIAPGILILLCDFGNSQLNVILSHLAPGVVLPISLQVLANRHFLKQYEIIQERIFFLSFCSNLRGVPLPREHSKATESKRIFCNNENLP